MSSQGLKAVYVRYKDHVYFRGFKNPQCQAVEREAVGWIKEENAELLLIVCDKAVSTIGGQVNGLVILRSCIISMVELPLDDVCTQHLNCQVTTRKTEYCASSQRSEKLNSQILQDGVTAH